MPKRKRKMLGWIAIVITVGFIGLVVMRVDNWSRDWTENTARLEPDAENVRLRPVHLDEPAAEVADRIRQWCDEQSSWSLESESESGDAFEMKLMRTTSLFRFVDDIRIELKPVPGGRGVMAYATSQSRLGKGDLGQNPRNLVELTKMLAGDS